MSTATDRAIREVAAQQGFGEWKATRAVLALASADLLIGDELQDVLDFLGVISLCVRCVADGTPAPDALVEMAQRALKAIGAYQVSTIEAA